MSAKKDIKMDLRSEPDFITRAISNFAPICWFLTIGALIITALALPMVRNFINSVFSINLQTAWSKILYQIDFYFLSAIFLVSGVGLIFNSMRHRRRTDKFNTSLIYFLVLSAICMVGYLIFFKSIL